MGEATQPELPGMTPQAPDMPYGTRSVFDSMKEYDIKPGRDMDLFMQGVFNKIDQDTVAKAVDAWKSENVDDPGHGESEAKELNTEAMKKEDKKPVKEAITMSADSPEEASMLMQIMKLAGVQQVTPDMIGAEEPTADNDADHDHDGDGQQDHAPQDCDVCAGDDEVGSGAMGKMRDMITKPDEEKAEETFGNSVGEKDLPKTSDIETLVNVHANKSQQQVRREYPGDNPLRVVKKEDKITELDLANSFRAQYEGFKKSYQEAAKPDYVDLDKDGNEKETMKKAAKDKEAK